MNPIKTILLTTALAVTGGAAFANNPASLPLQKTVSFADLDLSRNADAQTLYRRLNAAAKQVCAPAEGRTLAEKQRYHTCMDHALAQSVATVNRPLLTQVYASRGGNTAAPTRIATAR